jgi:hypothetical protein
LRHVAETAADSRHVVADIINVMLEELVHHRYELPGFSTLDRLGIQAREKIHDVHFASIADQLDTKVKALIDSLFKVKSGESQQHLEPAQAGTEKTNQQGNPLLPPAHPPASVAG